MSAMVVMRLRGVSFWPEFWTEYAVGFVFGLFLFQVPAMHQMDHSWGTATWKGGRAEFFSMATVMLGMGLVMQFVRPDIVTAPPRRTPRHFGAWPRWACWSGLSSPTP